MFTDLAKQLGPWSVTKMKLVHKCPFRAKKLFLEREPEIITDPESRSGAVVGIAIHNVMEQTLREFPRDIVPTIDDVYDHASRAMQNEIVNSKLTSKEAIDVQLLLQDSAQLLQRLLMHVYKNEGMLTFVEKEMGIDAELQVVDYESPSVFFKGKLDFLMISKSGSVGLLDHKTSQWATLAGQELQLKCYEALTLCSLKNTMIQDYNINLSSFRSGVVFIATGEILWADSRPAHVVESQGVSFLTREINACAEILSGGSVQRGNHCLECGYKHLCGSRRGMNKKKKDDTVIM